MSTEKEPKKQSGPVKTYLAVPYVEREDAKLLGAKWDKKTKQWYVGPRGRHRESLIERWPASTKEIVLTGEDREFGGNELFVDMIPSTCWFINVRSCVRPCDWDQLRRHVYERVKGRCECCRQIRKLEAHERWSYTNETCVQRLERLVALCRKCHGATHMGFSKMRGKGDNMQLHLKKCRHFTDEQLAEHLKEASKLWKMRNKIKWTLDLSLMTNNGIELVKNERAAEDAGEVGDEEEVEGTKEVEDAEGAEGSEEAEEVEEEEGAEEAEGSEDAEEVEEVDDNKK